MLRIVFTSSRNECSKIPYWTPFLEWFLGGFRFGREYQALLSCTRKLQSCRLGGFQNFLKPELLIWILSYSIVTLHVISPQKNFGLASRVRLNSLYLICDLFWSYLVAWALLRPHFVTFECENNHVVGRRLHFVL